MLESVTQGYIDPTSIKTFGVATAGIVAVAVVFRKVFGIHHALVPFLTALLISVLLALDVGRPTALGWLIVFLNACLLFCAAIGANESIVDVTKKKTVGSGKQYGGQAKSWFKTYFRD